MSNAGAAGAMSGRSVYLLDSSVLIRSLRGDASITARIDAVSQVYVSSIVLGELYFGAYESPSRPDAAIADVETIEKTVMTLSPDTVTARVYAHIKQDLKRRGLTMPDNDLWIAATAIQYNVKLAARDAHFDWIAGLNIEQ